MAQPGFDVVSSMAGEEQRPARRVGRGSHDLRPAPLRALPRPAPCRPLASRQLSAAVLRTPGGAACWHVVREVEPDGLAEGGTAHFPFVMWFIPLGVGVRIFIYLCTSQCQQPITYLSLVINASLKWPPHSSCSCTRAGTRVTVQLSYQATRQTLQMKASCS